VFTDSKIGEYFEMDEVSIYDKTGSNDKKEG
jgi:hypothetical protein